MVQLHYGVVHVSIFFTLAHLKVSEDPVHGLVAQGSKWQLFHFCYALGRAYGIMGRLCSGFKPTAGWNNSNSTYNQALMKKWSLIYGVSSCCSLWCPIWRLESCTGFCGAPLSLQPFNTEAVFRQARSCFCDFCHKDSSFKGEIVENTPSFQKSSDTERDSTSCSLGHETVFN